MLMMMSVGGDGDVFVHFFEDEEDLLNRIKNEDVDMPTKWLTAEEATEDINYWPENSAFLAEARVMELRPKDVITSWELTAKDKPKE